MRARNERAAQERHLAIQRRLQRERLGRLEQIRDELRGIRQQIDQDAATRYEERQRRLSRRRR
jgi:hypothetical protein